MGEKHVFGLSQTLAFERWRFSLVALSLKPNVGGMGRGCLRIFQARLRKIFLTIEMLALL
jgi:hypothetical protein